MQGYILCKILWLGGGMVAEEKKDLRKNLKGKEQLRKIT